MTDPTDRGGTTLGLAQLARTWTRRLGQHQAGPGHDALVVLEGPLELVGLRFPLAREAGCIPISRGDLQPDREPAQPVQLPSPYVSRPHAALEATSSGWRIVDRGSSNHTYVGTVKVEQQGLVYGDEVRLGDVALVFVAAERPALPPHALDTASGLLARQVLLAEAATGPHECLLLLELPGLRGLVQPESQTVVSELGRLLLRRWGDRLMGRLEADLFAVVHAGLDAAALREEARQLLQELDPLLAPRGVECRCAVLSDDAHQPLPRLLACARAALDRAPHTTRLVDAELGADAALPAGAALLRTVLDHPGRPLLVLSIQDEDRLRHQLGHDRLAACRWQLRRAVRRGADDPRTLAAGMLDQRLGVLLLDAAETIQPVREATETWLRQALTAAAPDLRFALRSAALTGERPATAHELRRALLEAAEPPGAPGPREPVELLPSAVAAPYSLIWVVASDTARIKATLDCAEVVTRFLACAAVAALATRREGRQAARETLHPHRRRRLPLGTWIALLRELAPALQGAGEVADLLARSLDVSRRGVRAAHLLERELLPLRNRFTHGVLAADEHRSAEQATRLLGQLNQLVRCLAPLAQLQLLTVLRSDPRRAGGARVTVRLHSGPREHFEVRQVEVRRAAPVFPGSTYLSTLDYRHLLELSPLVRLLPCPRCDREELFVADSLAGAGEPLGLSAVSTGHRLQLTLDGDDLPEGLALVLRDREP